MKIEVMIGGHSRGTIEAKAVPERGDILRLGHGGIVVDFTVSNRVWFKDAPIAIELARAEEQALDTKMPAQVEFVTAALSDDAPVKGGV